MSIDEVRKSFFATKYFCNTHTGLSEKKATIFPSQRNIPTNAGDPN